MYCFNKNIKTEWLSCPRCQQKSMFPSIIDRLHDGSKKIWWMCNNYEKCGFPIDLPGDVYIVQQSAEQAAAGFTPYPSIMKLPEKLRGLYPLTFLKDKQDTPKLVNIKEDPIALPPSTSSTVQQTECLPSKSVGAPIRRMVKKGRNKKVSILSADQLETSTSEKTPITNPFLEKEIDQKRAWEKRLEVLKIRKQMRIQNLAKANAIIRVRKFDPYYMPHSTGSATSPPLTNENVSFDAKISRTTELTLSSAHLDTDPTGFQIRSGSSPPQLTTNAKTLSTTPTLSDELSFVIGDCFEFDDIETNWNNSNGMICDWVNKDDASTISVEENIQKEEKEPECSFDLDIPLFDNL